MTDRGDELVSVLAEIPGVADTLLRQHSRQDDGHCGVCRGGNIQTGRALHPCRLYTLASLALVELVRATA